MVSLKWSLYSNGGECSWQLSFIKMYATFFLIDVTASVSHWPLLSCNLFHVISDKFYYKRSYKPMLLKPVFFFLACCFPHFFFWRREVGWCCIVLVLFSCLQWDGVHSPTSLFWFVVLVHLCLMLICSPGMPFTSHV